MNNNEQASAVPLIERLRSIPKIAILRMDQPTESSTWGIGSMCHEAADALDTMKQTQQAAARELERTAFEAAFGPNFMSRNDTADSDPDGYQDTHVQFAWRAWQARAAISTTAPAVGAPVAKPWRELLEVIADALEDNNTHTAQLIVKTALKNLDASGREKGEKS